MRSSPNPSALDVVYDCMVYLQAAASARGPASALLRLMEQNRVRLHVSDEVLAEVRDVLSRPEIQRKFPALTPARTEEFLETVALHSTRWSDVPHVFDLPRDPKDEKYLDLAIATRASFLITRDKDLLHLAEDPDFAARYPRLTILDPVAFLRLVAE